MLLNYNRPNVRGIKKCHFCGLYNGHRSKHCKNKDCPDYLSVRAMKTSGKSSVDPISLITDDDSLQFSVKVRDKFQDSCDNRNFVKITDKVIQSDENNLIIHKIGICFVDVCKYDSKSAKHFSCKHVKEAVNDCQKKAIGLTVSEFNFYKYFSHLNKLEKSDLWQFCVNSKSPIVQHLNETLFVVKCLPTENQQIEKSKKKLTSSDFFHCELNFNEKNGSPKFSCSCNRIKILISAEDNALVMENDACHHILMIYAALEGDYYLSGKFQMHLNSIRKKLKPIKSHDLPMESNPIANVIDDDLLLDQNMELSDCQIELLDDFSFTDQLELCDSFKLAEELLMSPEIFSTSSGEDGFGTDFDELNVDEGTFNIDFESILNSIIERINHNTSFYDESQNSTQEFFFFVHNDFFNCLIERFSPDPAKKCLPSETIFHNKGSHQGLTTFVYKFYQLSTIQRIFVTSSLNILVEKSFIQRENHKVENIESLLYNFEDNTLESTLANLNQIQPIELKKSINLGWESGVKHCFKIEWTANVLPVSSHGELKISFKYDHKKIN